jgi:MerR family transcriptional regulator, light-induced transcriptional regulator
VDIMATTINTWRPRSAARFPVRGLLGALLNGDNELAMDLVLRVLEETRSRTATFADLLHPAQVEVGNLWYSGQASYSDELQVALALRGILSRLGPTPAERRVRSGSRCVIAVPRGDPHDVGLLMLMHALQDHGWSTEVMGPVRSLDDVADHVATRPPRLFCLSAGDLPPLPQVERAISVIRGVRVPVLVGGAAFNRRPDLWRRVGADGHGTDVRVGVVLAHRFAGR